MRVQDSYFPLFDTTSNMQGRIAIVTGGACGIGSEIARVLAIHKCRVIMVNGNEKQCNQAISQVREELGQDATPQIEWRYCDMTDLIQVQEVFSALSDELPRLDICIFGSGIDAQHFQTDLHCIDAYFGITWLGHFYASNLLWPLLRKTSRMPGNKTAPRVIFEAPEQQFLEATTDGSSSDEDDFRRYEEEVSSEIFRRSRTSLILGVRHGLAERIVKRHHDNIYALAVQPTKAAVDADDDALPRRDSHSQSQDLCDRALDSLAKGGMPIRSTSRAVLYAATSPDVENEYLNGAYLTDAGVSGREKDLAAADPSLGPGFWDISERAIKAVVGADALTPWDACLDA